MGNPQKRKDREREKRKLARRGPKTPLQVANERKAARECGPCQLCCEVMSIHETQKPPRTRCPNQCATGCAIYDQRPPSCAGFLCLWRQGWGKSHQRPDQLGFVLTLADFPRLAEIVGSDLRQVIALRGMTDEAVQTPQARAVLASFVRAGTAVTVVSPSHFVLYGPKIPQGQALSAEQRERLERQSDSLKSEEPISRETSP